MIRPLPSSLFLSLILFFYFLTPGLSFAEKHELSDEELDQISAEGFLMHFTFDVASDEAGQLSSSLLPQLNLASIPQDIKSLIPADQLSSLQAIQFSPLNNLLKVDGNALQNAHNLFNVNSLGNVGVGINLFVFIGNLTNSTINHQSSNTNFSNIFSALQR